MLNLDLTTIAKICNGELVLPQNMSVEEVGRKKPEGVVLSSLLVKDDFIFVAYNGEKTDGHKYIPSAFKNGALAAICEVLPEELEGPCIRVENSLDALTTLADYYKKTLDINTVAIVGSVGKTSTKEIVASVLSKKYKVLKGEGNHNNLLGLSLEILRITDDIEIAVLEMGISDFGEMTRLAKLVEPDTVIFTNVGECHLEYLGDRDGVLKAKSECFEYMNKDGYVVLNGCDDKLATLAQINGKTPYRYGLENQNAYATYVKNNGIYGSDVTIVSNVSGTDEIKTHINMPGIHMVQNALAATVIGKLYGMNSEQIKDGIEQARALEGRSNVIQTSKYTILDDCYNASKTSMMAAIDLLGTSKGRKVAVLGDMFELGEHSKQTHEDIGRYAAGHGIEVILCVGTESKAMYEGAMREIMCEMQEICYFESLEALMERLPSILNEGDNILVKASHGMNFAKVVNMLKSL